MKYWRGYLTAAILGAFTWVLIQMGQRYTTLVDMIYPYVTRSIQTFLTGWTGDFDFLVWQTALVFLAVLLIATLVLVFIFRTKIVRWLGWALAAVMLVLCIHTGIYGVNTYAGPIEEDLRLDMVDYTQSELEAATVFYRDMANSLAAVIGRSEDGEPEFSDFETLASQTGEGYRLLSQQRSYSVYGGDHTPVKKLGWAAIYSAMGKTGVFCPLTGEAAVNPNIPDQGIPFAMAHEMAHRLCIPRDDEANFSAFLNCQASTSQEYQYSGYMMAYRFCIEALASVDEGSAETIHAGCSEQLAADLEGYDRFFDENRDEQMTRLVDTVTDTYTEATTEDTEILRSSICDYLVNWHIDQYVEEEEVEAKFDPLDKTQVDLTGLVNAKMPREENAE